MLVFVIVFLNIAVRIVCCGVLLALWVDAVLYDKRVDTTPEHVAWRKGIRTRMVSILKGKP